MGTRSLEQAFSSILAHDRSFKPQTSDPESGKIFTESGTGVYKNPHPQGWGYTDEARLRGLIQKTDF
ncbi:hypothetical protein [Oscillatoria acuminata]|uniref:hypothetical protein n=1 Tax=Oscillatoria acuminata TaxID=118323 RepID=UPI0002F8FC96|nr:hypothetical protein [Oscillatoria acuminata]